jgi:Ca-activated chloride channel family protein
MAVFVFRLMVRSARKVLSCSILAVAISITLTSLAQDIHLQPRASTEKQPAPSDAPADQLSLHVAPMRVNVKLVLVPVTVTDSLNRPVTGLNKEDFALLEGDKAQDIRYFSSEDAPISIGVLLDISRSMTDKIGLARTALAEFFDTSNPQDDYFVITFSDKPEVLADATSSPGTIRAKLADIKPAGHTALLDAIYLGMHKLHAAKYQRRALVIISDGGDNHSRFTPAELKNLVMEADVQIYGIGIYSRVFHTPEEWSGKRLLTQITEATGGHTVTVSNPRELPDAASSISTELRNQYVLGYAPSEVKASGWRKIRVRVAPRDNSAPMQLYWRKGYMSPGD